jgi:2-C-methyl-D-erythritol 4-phosphate cytidylyltransferase
MNFVVLLAGGKGERIKTTGVPKQFYEAGGKPVFAYALESIAKCSLVDAVCVVSMSEKQDIIKKAADTFGLADKIFFAEPGKTRQHSVKNGLEALDKAFLTTENDLAAVHDAARPLVSCEDFYACFEAAAGFDGATPVLPPSDTMYFSEDKVTISSLINRDNLFAGQTPECYNFKKYLAAFGRLSDDDICKIRGGSEIAFLAGMKIHLFPGNPQNVKITTERDLKFFEFLIEKEGFGG